MNIAIYIETSCRGPTARPLLWVGRTVGTIHICESVTRVSDWRKIIHQRCYSSQFMFHHAMWIMIIICLIFFHAHTGYITVSDFINYILAHQSSCRTDFRYWRGAWRTRLRSDAPKGFITPVTYHTALPMQPNYCMINDDSIFNLSSGVTCNWCVQMDAPRSLALIKRSRNYALRIYARATNI